MHASFYRALQGNAVFVGESSVRAERKQSAVNVSQASADVAHLLYTAHAQALFLVDFSNYA
jgi:hypothetical protein